MRHYSKKTITCPVEKTLSVIGNKWTVLIIRDLLLGTKRFGELERSLSGISPRTLSARLKDLEDHGIVDKKVFPVVPLHVEYTLTKHGMALGTILGEMSAWSKKHYTKK